jgi:hypothetical protein
MLVADRMLATSARLNRVRRSTAGHEPETPIPDTFARAAETLPDPVGLVPLALKALQIVLDSKHSELAGLLKEANDQSSLQRIDRLRLLLQSV